MTISDPKIVVRSDDEIIVFVGTPTQHSLQSDNEQLVKEVRNHLQARTPVPLLAGKPHMLFVAEPSTYLGIVAAMFAPNPGRSLLLEAPERLLFELREYNRDGIGYLLR